MVFGWWEAAALLQRICRSVALCRCNARLAALPQCSIGVCDSFDGNDDDDDVQGGGGTSNDSRLNVRGSLPCSQSPSPKVQSSAALRRILTYSTRFTFPQRLVRLFLCSHFATHRTYLLFTCLLVHTRRQSHCTISWKTEHTRPQRPPSSSGSRPAAQASQTRSIWSICGTKVLEGVLVRCTFRRSSTTAARLTHYRSRVREYSRRRNTLFHPTHNDPDHRNFFDPQEHIR